MVTVDIGGLDEELSIARPPVRCARQLLFLLFCSTLFDLKREITEKAASVRTDCTENGLMNGIERIAKLVGERIGLLALEGALQLALAPKPVGLTGMPLLVVGDRLHRAIGLLHSLEELANGSSPSSGLSSACGA